MEIIGTNQSEKERKAKKSMIIISIFIILLLLASIATAVAIYYLKIQEFKLEVDGNMVSASKYTSSKTFDFVTEGSDEFYVSLSDVAGLIKYKYYNGGYKQYTEDSTKGYLESANEVVTFEKDSDTIYKTPVGELDYTDYTLSKPVIQKNNKLYIYSKDLALACNLKIAYNQENNKISINTIDYLTAYYSAKYPDASLESFNNKKALLYGLLVVINPNSKETQNKKYGIHDLQNQEVIGMKYSNIEFIEGTEEFLVTTEENKVGIITSTGETKIAPTYDALKQIEKKRNLYLATNNGKSGIIEKNGKILIYLEYEKIGVDLTDFATNDIKNKYILFDKVIPIKQNDKWGLYDIKGNVILEPQYKCIGCVSKSNDGISTNSILAIPEIEGIVFGQEIEIDKRKETYYGIFSTDGEWMVPVALDKVYSVTVSGKEEYTMIDSLGNSYDVIQYMNVYYFKKDEIKEKKNEQEELDEETNNVKNNTVNTSTDTNQNTTVDTQEQSVQENNTVQYDESSVQQPYYEETIQQ